MFISKFIRSAAFGFAAVIMVSATASAQSKVLVVDAQKVISESEVGKHVQRQLEAIGKTMGTELKASATPLQTSAQSLNTELQGKTQQEAFEVIKARPDLQKKMTEMETNKQKLAYEQQVKQREIAMTEQKAISQIAVKVREIIVAVAKERSADVVLDKGSVIYGDPVDITDTVLARLNTQMTRVSVVRERLPRQAPAK